MIIYYIEYDVLIKWTQMPDSTYQYICTGQWRHQHMYICSRSHRPKSVPVDEPGPCKCKRQLKNWQKKLHFAERLDCNYNVIQTGMTSPPNEHFYLF